jgi:hypothetical protein
MGKSDQPREETTMKQHGQPIEDHSTIGIGSSIAPSCAELSIDNGVWLEMEHNERFPVITQGTGKKTRVSLNVSLDEL